MMVLSTLRNISFSILVGLLASERAQVQARPNAALDVRAVSSAGMTVIAPGTVFDGRIAEFVWPYGTVWLNQTADSRYAYTDFSISDNPKGVLSSHGTSLCLRPTDSNRTSYFVVDPAVFTPKTTCDSPDSFGLYRGAYLTWGGGYDMFCIFTNSQNDALLIWVPNIRAYEQAGPSQCAYRARISVNGYSVQPAPSTPIPPTTTMPSGPSQITTTPPITNPPATTTSIKPNPIVITAISSASSYVNKASSAVSSYSANPSSSSLAKAAEDAIEDAIYHMLEAQSVADDEDSDSLIPKLLSISDQLFAAAARAIVAQALLTAAAASALVTAIAPVAGLISSAAAAAQDPTQNPSPTSRPPTSSRATSTSSTVSYICTICLACNDASLPTDPGADPNDPDVQERGLGSGFNLFADTDWKLNEHDLNRRRAEILDSEMSSISMKLPDFQNLELFARDGGSDVSIFQGKGRGKLCKASFDVPTYTSWSGTGGSNKYMPFFNYWDSKVCTTKVLDYGFLSSTTAAGITPPDSTGQIASPRYAAEHVYEIQSVEGFIKWAWENDPILKDRTMFPGVDYCGSTGLGALMKTKPTVAWSSYGSFPYDVAPIQEVFNQMSSTATSDFVYLEEKTNGVKQLLFMPNSKMPGIRETYQSALPQAIRIIINERYLRDSRVEAIFKRVSSRIRDSMYRFGQACAASSDPAYNKYGAVNWLSTYDNWEKYYVSFIQEKMISSARGNAEMAIKDIENLAMPKNTPNMKARQDLIMLGVRVSGLNIFDITNLNVQGLKRS